MRARPALAMAMLLALPLALAAVPAPHEHLQRHAAVQLAANLELVLGRVGAAQGTAPPAHGGSAPGLPVEWLAGERRWTQWVYAGAPQAVDADGDGIAELRASVGGLPGAARLTVAGTEPSRVAWAAWVEQGEARWGLAGAGLTAATSVGLRDGTLSVAASAGRDAWHAAFAFAGGERRSLAWLGEGSAPPRFEGAVGHGWQLRLGSDAQGLRVLALDGARGNDLTLRGAPEGASVARSPQGTLHYRAPQGGGALGYEGDAGPVGQPGALAFSAEPLPEALDLAPEGEGFAVQAAQPTDVLLDWRPPAGDGLRAVGNGVITVRVGPGAAGGLVVGGPRGTLAVLRPAPAGSLGEVVELDTQGGLVVNATSPVVPAVVSAVLGGTVAWAMLGGKRRTKARRA